MKSGDILFIEPHELGAGILRYQYSEDSQEKNFSDLMTISRDYMRKKSMSFAGVVFLSGAKKMLSERYMKANMSVEDTIRDYDDRIQALHEEHLYELMERNDKIQQQPDTAKIRSLVNSPFKLTLKCKLYLTIVVLHKEKPAFLRKLLLQVPNLPKIVDTVCVSRGHSESTDFSMSPDGYQAFHTEFLEICNTFYEVLKGGE